MGLFDNRNRKRNEQQTADNDPTAVGNDYQEVVNRGHNDREPVSEVQEGHSPQTVRDLGAYDRHAPRDTSSFAHDAEDDSNTKAQDGAPQQSQTGAFAPTPIKSYSEKKPVDHQIGATKILAIINQKGGVGKSTTAVNLAAALGELGKQVLLIDLDPQGNSTSGLGIDKGQVRQCVYDVLLNDVPPYETIIPDITERVDLMPATINLAGAEVELVSAMSRENRLKTAISGLRGQYDYILIDCPPSLGLLTINALVAADELIIPIQTEFYALEGVTKLLESMKRVKNLLNPDLDIFGILLTMYDGRTTLSRQVASEVRNFFGEQVFETIIPRSVKLSEAPSYGIPITQYDPLGKGAEAYTELAKEVIARG